MPTYEYRCPKCGGVEDIFFISYHKMLEREADFCHACPSCRGAMERVVSAPHVCERPTLMKITGS